MERAELLRCVRTGGAGFLLAVLWMDLMFDVQVLSPAPSLEPALVSIATYYRRVTVDSWPMGALIGVVMTITVSAALWPVVRERNRHNVLSFLLVAIPVALALVRVFPNAVRLSGRSDALPVQANLARSICVEHLACFAFVGAFLFLQLWDVRRSAPNTKGG
jgi:hypothetical protein